MSDIIQASPLNLPPEEDVLKTRVKKSTTLVIGYRCDSCGVETVVYNDTTVPNCQGCNLPNPKVLWKNIVVNDTTVKTLKI